MQLKARIGCLLIGLLAGCASFGAHAEDGYDLWLRYRPLPPAVQRQLQADISGLVAAAQPSPVAQSALAELSRGIGGLSGRAPPRLQSLRNGSLLVGTPASVAAIAALKLPLQALGEEGYLLRSVRQQGNRIIVIAANTDRGVLYGSFALLAHLQRGGTLGNLDIHSAPRVQLRMLDHWDNLDGRVERGYAARRCGTGGASRQ